MPAVVAQRLSELLQTFPSAAMGGVQWQTLVRKYEERHCTRLNLAELGHDSALGAATALLWDVLRLVEAEDTDNPVVALEDSVVLTAQPRLLASWPSLYQVLCRLVMDYGAPHEQEDQTGGARGILVSQLKPLLQRHWHSTFDEAGLSYLTEEGSSIKLKKMKHLLQAVLRWRDQRAAWQAEAGARVSAVEEALQDRLELTPSKRHNDLLLICIPAAAAAKPEPLSDAQLVSEPVKPSVKPAEVELLPPRMEGTCWADQVDDDADDQTTQCIESPRSSDTGSCSSDELAKEVARLRAENNALRLKNELLGLHTVAFSFSEAPAAHLDQMELSGEVFDNPFEPPPEIRSFWSPASTSLPLSTSLSSGSATPSSQALGSSAESDPATPLALGAAGGQVCTFMPIWFSLGDRVEIPNGVVEQARAIFERGGKGSIPSFFAPQ
eukprot:CAMPEP_0197896094 /NCGR_PEP_ID=MMETSP1439-20131203/38959_1 /TAXON_ID=66791 /ORGANISM="Gonyaulax spinifera, Strain CCMP409" /LENGTH=438 /DNA_ID=CAMNT_0043516579 /DNA_START=107 /DNA_END=1423 /DNA_ORIENTATION=+